MIRISDPLYLRELFELSQSYTHRAFGSFRVGTRLCYITLILLLFGLSYARAQNNQVFSATVLDELNQPVPFASVRLLHHHTGVITNADGSIKASSVEQNMVGNTPDIDKFVMV